MTEWPLTNPLSTNVTSLLHNHERWKTSIPDSKFRTTCHKPLNWRTCIQSPPKIFQSVVRLMSSVAIGLREWTLRHLATSRKHLNIFGVVRKSWKFLLETRIKCIRKSLSFDSGKESSFQLCYSAIVSGIVTGVTPVNYWPIFFSVLSNNPRTLCESKLGWVSL